MSSNKDALEIVVFLGYVAFGVLIKIVSLANGSVPRASEALAGKRPPDTIHIY
jgi:hypothetical protein